MKRPLNINIPVTKKDYKSKGNKNTPGQVEVLQARKNDTCPTKYF